MAYNPYGAPPYGRPPGFGAYQAQTSLPTGMGPPPGIGKVTNPPTT
ncbi:U1 snRNP-associated protein [Erysiphe neolycopersici]|uniref:U1 snRNP-associated protein n=1 Tax=Erysiphe neolycopersici TaxID=212602 RepID=A0A420I4P0_9PEZI|nr:U1 snRNP-associated protein [Erysiphe neolycopersici]